MATSNVELPEGITYRQFDHWVTKGYIHAGNPGSGRARLIEPEEQAVLQVMARLVGAGFMAGKAAEIARQVWEELGSSLPPDGLVIELTCVAQLGGVKVARRVA